MKKAEDVCTELSPEDSLLGTLTQWDRKKVRALMNSACSKLQPLTRMDTVDLQVIAGGASQTAGFKTGGFYGRGRLGRNS